jgi:transposase
MKAYSLDLREKIVTAHLAEKMSIRKVAIRFAVSKSLVQKLVKQQKIEGDLQPKQRGKPQRASPDKCGSTRQNNGGRTSRCYFGRVV